VPWGVSRGGEKNAPLSGLRDLKRANILHRNRTDASARAEFSSSGNVNPGRKAQSGYRSSVLER